MALLPTDEYIKKFRADGFLLLPNFLDTTQCDLLNFEIKKLVDKMEPAQERTMTFETGNISKHLLDDYFLTSGDKIRFFFESSAVDEHGNLKFEKAKSLNKIGHALHWLNDAFRRVTFSQKVKTVAKQLKLIDPKIIHSMYIFKSPNIGSEVVPHQDATYLYCEPSDKVVGLWIALEDASVDNGCLNFIPGSHLNERVQSRLIRAMDKDGHLQMTYTGSSSVEYDKDRFVPVPAKKGDLILIDARVVHQSAANTSDRPRPIYTFHLLDDHESEFSKLNWIQPTEESPFTPLYSTE